MISLHGTAAQVTSGGGDAVRPADVSKFPKKEATWLSLLESTCRTSSVMALSVTHVDSRSAVRMVFQNSVVAQLVFARDTAALLSCQCQQSKQLGGAVASAALCAATDAVFSSSNGTIHRTRFPFSLPASAASSASAAAAADAASSNSGAAGRLDGGGGFGDSAASVLSPWQGMERTASGTASGVPASPVSLSSPATADAAFSSPAVYSRPPLPPPLAPPGAAASVQQRFASVSSVGTPRSSSEDASVAAAVAAVDIRTDASLMLLGHACHVALSPPNEVVVLRRQTVLPPKEKKPRWGAGKEAARAAAAAAAAAADGLAIEGRVEDLSVHCDKVHALRWCGTVYVDRMLRLYTTQRAEKETAVLLTVALETRQIEERAAFRLPGDVSAAGGSEDGTLWATACHNGALHMFNATCRSHVAARQGGDGVVGAKILFSEVFVVVAHTTPSLAVYDRGLNPVRVVMQGICDSPVVQLSTFFPAGATVAAMDCSVGGGGGGGGVLTLVARGGPLCYLKLAGTTTPSTLLRSLCGGPRAPSGDAVGRAIHFIKNTPKHLHLTLISELVGRISKGLCSFNRTAASAAAVAAADGGGAHREEDEAVAKGMEAVLCEFKDGYAAADKARFAALFYRYFSFLLNGGDVLNAFRLARALDQAGWARSLHAYCEEQPGLSSLAELALHTCDKADRVAQTNASTLLGEEARPEYSLAALTEGLSALHADSSLFPGLGEAQLLYRLATLLRSVDEGRDLLQKLLERARNNSREADAEVLREMLLEHDSTQGLFLRR
eukprot:Rhum_TRINITY_DN12880_c0_g1::Rhum_TRINITY_DN12880_c0_g1_i1::g.55073::m.55073